jgi:cytochrome P450
MEIFSDETRRNPFPLYEHLRRASPVFKAPPPFEHWMVFDYDNVKRVTSDHETFSSAVPAPKNWFLFHDPPRHTQLRGLIAQAFTPRMVASLETRIREISTRLLDQLVPRGAMDLVVDYAIPLPMMVIAEMIGIPLEDWVRYRRWSDAILRISHTMRGMDDAECAAAMAGFRDVTAEMSEYLAEMIADRRARPLDDLLSRLVHAQVDGEQLSHDDILGFFQLLVVGGQETTANLIASAVVCLLENPGQLELLRDQRELLPSAIEEVLRFRSPVQWLMRTPTRDIELAGQTIPRGSLVLPMLGSANRDERYFPEPERFDITREANPHLAFGHGIHFCMGAPLARLEAKIALTDLLDRVPHLQLVSDDPWPPRQALNVHGPASLPVRFGSLRCTGAAAAR